MNRLSCIFIISKNKLFAKSIISRNRLSSELVNSINRLSGKSIISKNRLPGKCINDINRLLSLLFLGIDYSMIPLYL